MSSPIKKFAPLIVSLLFIGIVATIVLTIKKSGYHLIYSPTPSMPVGFYLVVPAEKFKKMDIVEFSPPANTLKFIKEKHWVPESGMIIKYVFGVPGDHVCVKNSALFINNKKICKVYKYYEEDKLLPQTNFCGKLKDDEYMLLSTERDRSFDGRYFGPIKKSKISGKAISIFTL